MTRFCPREINADPEIIRDFTQKFGLTALAARLLISRGIQTTEQAEAFLHPGIYGLHDPMLLPDMEKAVSEIKKAIRENKNICIYGDYDADGIIAASILTLHLRGLGGRTFHYIPNRSEGYGLNGDAVREIAEKGAKLLITVDCGITAHAEIQLAGELGLSTIVTDHHQCKETLPDCLAVVDPARPDCTYPYRELCGAGVALKLVQALSGAEATLEYIDLACIATVADIVPLTGENRVIVSLGLNRINSGEAAEGVKALIKACGLQDKRIESEQIAFVLAPRLNASGRVSDPENAFKLLTSKEQLQPIARELDAQNALRQDMEAEVLKQAMNMLQTEDLAQNKAILLSGEWNHGVIGIVASRLVERFYKPVILFSEEEDKLTGSGRSIPGVHLFDALKHFENLFIRFGGHAQAAGVSLTKDNFQTFKTEFNRFLNTEIPKETFLQRQSYDLEAELNELSLKTVEDLRKLAPFGMGNPAPLFRAQGVCFKNVAVMGSEGAHIRATVCKAEQSAAAVGFNLCSRYNEMPQNSELDILFSMEKNEWKGSVKPQLNIRQLSPMPVQNTSRFIGELQDLFFEAYFENAGSSSDSLSKSLPVADPVITAREWIQEDIQGSLFLLFTPEGAQKFLDSLEKENLLSELELCTGVPPAHLNAYNAILFAPQLNQIDFGNYKRILVADNCLSQSIYSRLYELSKGRELVLAAAPSERFTGRLQTGREELIDVYKIIKKYEGLYASKQQFIRKLSNETTSERWKLDFALRVFSELELINITESEGFFIRVPNAGKRELTESTIYRLMQQAEEEYRGFMGGSKG